MNPDEEALAIVHPRKAHGVIGADARTAALAAAIGNHRPIGLSETQIAHDRGRCGVECAAAILAEMPADWCGHDTTIARLRAALESVCIVGDLASVTVARAALGEEGR